MRGCGGIRFLPRARPLSRVSRHPLTEGPRNSVAEDQSRLIWKAEHYTSLQERSDALDHSSAESQGERHGIRALISVYRPFPLGVQLVLLTFAHLRSFGRLLTC